MLRCLVAVPCSAALLVVDVTLEGQAAAQGEPHHGSERIGQTDDTGVQEHADAKERAKCLC